MKRCHLLCLIMMSLFLYGNKASAEEENFGIDPLISETAEINQTNTDTTGDNVLNSNNSVHDNVEAQTVEDTEEDAKESAKADCEDISQWPFVMDDDYNDPKYFGSYSEGDSTNYKLDLQEEEYNNFSTPEEDEKYYDYLIQYEKEHSLLPKVEQ